MLAFSACVLAGGAFTAALRYYAPSPVLHLAWLAFATTSILVGTHDAVHAPPVHAHARVPPLMCMACMHRWAHSS